MVKSTTCLRYENEQKLMLGYIVGWWCIDRWKRKSAKCYWKQTQI